MCVIPGQPLAGVIVLVVSRADFFSGNGAVPPCPLPTPGAPTSSLIDPFCNKNEEILAAE